MMGLITNTVFLLFGIFIALFVVVADVQYYTDGKLYLIDIIGHQCSFDMDGDGKIGICPDVLEINFKNRTIHYLTDEEIALGEDFVRR